VACQHSALTSVCSLQDSRLPVVANENTTLRHHTQRQSNDQTLRVIIITIIINEYYYSVMESKKLQEHLTTEKNKTNDSVTQVKNRSRTVRDQTSS